tara:strand:+ start:1257 stop:1979 length:723 start_codon:yes stop_codon:yes gene_type:complete
MNFINLKSPNFSKKPRNIKKIKFIIIHYTGMQSARVSLERLTSPKHKVSSHYLIDRAGMVFKLVDDLKIAWHAGKSKWKEFKNLNNNSIGIELVNKGHRFGYQKFTKKQILSLIGLCKKLKSKYRIKNHSILGHSDIAPLRKTDPGEKFPWPQLTKRQIEKQLLLTKENFLSKSLNNNQTRNYFFKNLYKIGYRYFNKNKSLKTDKLIIKSFQRRYRQQKISGKIDLECLQISAYLTKNT